MNKQRIKLIIFVLLFLIIILCLKFVFTPLITDHHGYPYTIKPGESIKSVIDDLYYKNIIKNRLLFILLVKLYKGRHDIKAGEYLFPKGTTPYSLLNQIFTGSGFIYHQFTIVPGWTMRQLRAAIANESHLQHTLQNLNDEALMDHLGHPDLKPEGEFYPDTYFFADGTSDFLLLKRAFKAMQDKLNVAWQGRELGLPFKNMYEVLIIASMIEKETEFDVERPIIAGVIINRLHKNMLLQIDPSVIYGLGTHFNGTIYKKDLLAKTPYNTYINKGLPPTPIAMPGSESLMAVVHPQHHHYLYFVARHGKDGPHQFSETLQEHYMAVAAAKKLHAQFFNNILIRYYLLKLFSDQVMRFPLIKSE
ncbi:MAG: hypothetical protein K0S27_1330 [Gammaproteobacteria bacterium]|jgi:UPF0755 protein|nr:hypothetical protein [Gammaproteobacteria bacterium]